MEGLAWGYGETTVTWGYALLKGCVPLSISSYW